MIRTSDSMPFLRGPVAWVLGGLYALTLPACSQQAEIGRYRAPKQEATDSVHDFGAMASQAVPAGGSQQLAYETPEGWTPGQVGGMRKAAFGVEDGERKVAITVIDLATTRTAGAGDLLLNVNRWRQQIRLGELTAEELENAISPIQVAGAEAHYVELVGPEDADPRQAILGIVAIRGGKAWFFKLWGDAELALQEKERFRDFAKSITFEPSRGGMSSAVGHGGMPSSKGHAGMSSLKGHAGMPSVTGQGGGSPLAYETPEGWTQGQIGGMRKAAFSVEDGERKVEITAIDLAAGAGDLLPNVNRWRQQIQLGELTEEELGKAIRSIQVGGVEGHYVELLGPEDAERAVAILGVVAIHRGKAWFFKMTGDADLALREKDHFEVFVKSVKFAATKGAERDD